MSLPSLYNRNHTDIYVSEFIDLHFYNNIAFLPGSDAQTIGHFLDTHERILNTDISKRCPPHTKPGKGPFIYLMGFIDVTKVCCKIDRSIHKFLTP